MPPFGELFELPAITALRQQRADDIYRVLGTGAPTATALTYALARHWLEGAEAAARAGDGTLLAWYRHAPADDTARLRTDTPIGPAAVLHPKRSQLRRSAIADTPYYVIDPETLPADGELLEQAKSGLAAAAAAGFAVLVRDNAPIICLLQQRTLGDTLFSWTITRLPGTTFTDYTGHPLVLGRCGATLKMPTKAALRMPTW